MCCAMKTQDFTGVLLDQQFSEQTQRDSSVKTVSVFAFTLVFHYLITSLPIIR